MDEERDLYKEEQREQYIEKKQEDYTEAFWNRQIGILKSSYINTIIIALNIIIFIYGFFAGGMFVDKFDHRSELILAGTDYYRLVSAMFLHADVEHLFSNMLILFFVGANVEYDLGHIPYAFLYFLSGIIGNLASTYWDYRTGNFIPAIGASGAVFGIIGAVAVIVFFGRKNLRKGSNLMVRLALMIGLSIYSGFTADNIDNAAHIGGLLGGVIIALLITIIGRKKYTMEEWL
ncbi:rhomboid family intramembrane serine protease [Butyrivibrio sp. XPD2002]|uniref:rhomboid family intramembrane serine protease n=1 Tax=Butyrivibrio sp. XPD2002 TaxID=1280665 RepID=UPI000422EB6F|nr:rhomboid family intramembrane serine protease [Butyrivibrio sp. XPD2002]